MAVPGAVVVAGQNVVLEDEDRQVHAVVAWTDGADTGSTVELTALLLAVGGKARTDDDMVFYNQPISPDGAVRHLGVAPSETGNEARVALDLDAVSDDVDAVALVASVEEGAFGGVGDLRLVLRRASGAELATFPVLTATTETALHLGEVYRRQGRWRFRAVGQGWDTGLAGLATDFGITVDNEPAEVAGASTAPEVTAGPVGVVPGAPSRAVDMVVVGAMVPDARRPARGTGVRTVRAKPIRVAPSVLADDDSWQPARLFSISGVGVAEEQEKRATSTLLSTMVAVKRFGRGITAHLGGPSGPMETFLEVHFPLGERTVIPDGLIRVSRGGRTWTALVETKTGTGQLRAAQVEAYLDVARERGFDAVVTISNEIAPSAGVHPLVVDPKKLKKVALHHLSWAEVLHEARMLLVHRGADDQLQAWILHELIRYLTHPRSGALNVPDMGAEWVTVREAVAAGTLRTSDRKLAPVVESWARLARHLVLHLTSDLGVTVTQVLPRKLAADPAAWAHAGAAQLATEGTFDATFRVPGAVGPVSVVADVRTSKVRVSVDVPAPLEGGAKRRIGWLLRQLGDAPDALLVEVCFSGRAESTCEQLGDVRTDTTALVAGRTADVSAFRLTSTQPLGVKRSGVKGAFVPSVTAAVESFYRDVVQPLRPWVPPAPVLPEPVGGEQPGGEQLD